MELLPKEKASSVTIDREELTAALQRVAQFTDARSKAVTLTFQEKELVLKSRDLEASGESEESLEIAYQGKPVTLGFNAQYILDFLGACETESVIVEFDDGESAGLFRQPGVDYRYVVMPMRV